MDREYELFEYRADGSSSWRGVVHGLESARVAIWLLADEIGRECFATDPATKEIVLARTPFPGAKRIFQIAYGNALSSRAHLLYRHGYDATSAGGNERAKHVLCMHSPCDLFVIGDAAPEQVRLEMVRWLRVNYPGTRILALNPPQFPGFDSLRYNAPNEPANGWLKLMSSAVHQSGHIGQAF